MKMLIRTFHRTCFERACYRAASMFVVCVSLIFASGCHDGPLYALKTANPYFTLKEWKEDDLIGPTDHARRKEMLKLASSMGSLPDERQKYWLSHLEQIMKNDQSVEMRRLAVNAAGYMRDASGLNVVKDGLKDESSKVRMEACRALARTESDESTLLLAETAGIETDLDVRHAAMDSLAKFKSPIAVEALRVSLNDRNPATRSLAMKSLRGATGKDYGNDPQVWIAALDGKSPSEPEVSIAQRIRNLF
jgi:HEAT repeats